MEKEMVKEKNFIILIKYYLKENISMDKEVEEEKNIMIMKE